MNTVLEREKVKTTKKQQDVYFESNNLNEIEGKLNSNLKINHASKIMICIALSQIKNRGLYKQSGATSFKSYLKMHRIPINYSTALDYSIIGDNYLKYEEELRQVSYNEKDGLKKLLFLHKALTTTQHEPADIFRKVKQMSLREFKKYTVDSTFCSPIPDKKNDELLKLKIKIDDEVIFLAPSEIELIWLNKDIDKKLGVPNLYKDMQRYLYNAIKQFFGNRFN